MKSKPLWKNIGKQSGNSSGQSSFEQNKNKKGFEINFSDQILSPISINHQVVKHIDSIRQNYFLSQQSGHERTPMILTTLEIDVDKYEEEQVLQAISLQSSKQKIYDIHHILGSFKEIEGRNKSNLKKEVKSGQKQSLKAIYKKKEDKKKILQLNKKMQTLKKSFIEYGSFLSQTINRMKYSIVETKDRIEEVITQKYKKQKPQNEPKLQSVNEIMYKRQIQNLKQSLKKQKNKSLQYKLELQNEIKKLQTEIESKEDKKKKQQQFQIMKVQQIYVIKIKNLQVELSQYKNQRDNALLKINKYKEDLFISGNNFQKLNQENNMLRKNIKQLKDKLQDHQALVRKAQNKITLEREKLENQSTYNSKQIARLKQECNRLCDLLKDSEAQLKQCDLMFTSILKKNKDLEQQNSKLNNKQRDVDLLYYKKLQGFDKILLEIQNSLQEVNKNYQHEKQQFTSQIQKYEKQMERMSFKQTQLKNKEYQIQQLKKQLEKQFYILEKKEEGMKAEYRTAIQLQNATKDKWYQRYYNFFPQKEVKNVIRQQMNSPTRDTSNFPKTARYHTRNECMQSPVRQKISPPKQLYKAKSQKNFTVQTVREGMQRDNSKFLQMKKAQSFKEYNLNNRIDSLRKELTKQLSLMAQH